MGDSCHCDIRISKSSNLWCHSFSPQRQTWPYNPIILRIQWKKKKLSIGESIRCCPWDLVTK